MVRLNEDIEAEDIQVRREAVLRLANLDDQRAVVALNEVFEHGLEDASVRHPNCFIMIAERAQDGPWEDYRPWPRDELSWDDMSAYSTRERHDWFEVRLSQARHLGGVNAGFADGHAKWMRWAQTLEPSGPGMHNPDHLVPPARCWK